MTIPVTITLTNGRVVLVDADDLDMLSQYTWSPKKQIRGDDVYATTRVQTPEGRKRLYMHRMVVSAPPGKVVDHINHDTLDNRRRNLRVCTQQENSFNKSMDKTFKKHSKYKGVTRAVHYKSVRWVAGIFVEGKRRYLGVFAQEEDAARAYDEAAKKHFGEFANLNFKDAA